MVAGEITHLLPSWQLHLRALNRSPKTIETYLEAARQLSAFLTEQGMPTDVATIRREHIETVLVHLQGLHSASTAAKPPGSG